MLPLKSQGPIVFSFFYSRFGNKTNIFSAIKIPAILYTLLFVLMTFNFRITDWFVLRATPGIRQDIIVTLFTYLKQHSHQYFQNHFAGSLLNKITDMASGGASILQKLEQTFPHWIQSLKDASIAYQLLLKWIEFWYSTKAISSKMAIIPNS